jgi:flagella basal body P-ring formation protein FlgA
MARLIALVAALALATPAFAGPVDIKANPVDDDGCVTLGDIFANAGGAAGVVVAERAGPSVVLEAGQLQSLARRSGLDWSNPQGLRRVVVRQGGVPAAEAAGRPAAAVAGRPGATAEVLTYSRSLAAGEVIQPADVAWTTVQAHQAPAGGPHDAEQVIGLSAKRALRAGAVVSTRDLASPQVIARNDMVQVAYVVGGVTLTVTGRATRAAALGEAVPVLNTTSGRTIDAVASGPGQAIAGPAALAARSQSTARQG